MHYRCGNPNSSCFKNYGARGIKVCDRWRGTQGFLNYLEDMGPSPGPRYTVERIDNDGPYSPENCRWATYTEQGRNHRNNHLLTYRGKTYPISKWAEITGIKGSTIQQRVGQQGWAVEDALEIRPRGVGELMEELRRLRCLLRKNGLDPGS